MFDLTIWLSIGSVLIDCFPKSYHQAGPHLIISTHWVQCSLQMAEKVIKNESPNVVNP